MFVQVLHNDESEIDLLYYFTFRAMCQWTNQDYENCITDKTTLETHVAEITGYGNIALTNSEISFTFNVVYIHVDDKGNDEGESPDSLDQLDAITNNPMAHALRDEYSADLVVHIFHYARDGYYVGKGIGWVPSVFPTRSLGFSSSGGDRLLVRPG